jgi:hypothetical protein
MKLIRRYAIEPKALVRWEDFRYVMEKLSFADGRVLVTIPRKWQRQLLDSLGDIGDIERARFVEKLQRYKQTRMIASGAQYNSTLRWVDNAAEMKVASAVDAILISVGTQAEDPSLPYPTPAEIDEDFFSGAREVRCAGTAANLVAAADVLLESSAEAIFVDPYFRIAKDWCFDVLVAFARRGALGKCQSFVVYTSEDYKPKGGEGYLRRICDKRVAPVVGRGFRIAFRFVSSEKSQQSFHARYLLTERGGLRYDKGFEASQPPQFVDISLLDRNIHEELIRLFADGQNGVDVIDTWTWESG